MINAFFSGIVPGLILSAAIGPVFFLLVQTSIQRGFKLAMIMEFGIVLSDSFCIFLAYLGLASFFQNPEYKELIFIAGSIVLVVFGVFMFLSHKKSTFEVDEEMRKGDRMKLFWKGFFFNISNPSVIFFWMGFVGLTIPSYVGNKLNLLAYFIGTLLTVFSIDVLKAWSAHKIKVYMTPKAMSNFNKISGIGIATFGVFVFVKEILFK
ncbi:MAG: LysE family translocator [Bacteroidia bacterium]|nr:LysE family translocator [Bacteroidia bacterium]MCZ2249678.1 LysE family translocator [Bacteroidia bacterium]